MKLKPSKISDQKMLALMDYCVKKGMCENETEYLNSIEFPRTNISNIRSGHQSFTRDHIYKACEFTGANANWIYGFEANMMRKQSLSAIDRLKQAVIVVEQELKGKKAR